MKYLYALALFTLSAFGAEDCSLRGVAKSVNGSPVAGLQINVGNFGLIRGGTSRETKTQGDGSFSFATLPCGKYMVTVYTFDVDSPYNGPLMVDIRKQPVIQLTVPNVDPLASLLYVEPGKEPEATAADSNEPPKAASASEDPAVSVRRREYFERLNPTQLAAFDAAPLADKKAMYVQAVSLHMMGPMEGDPAPPRPQASAAPRRPGLRKLAGVAGVPGMESMNHRTANEEQDQNSRWMLNRAAAIIGRTLSPEEAAAFARAPEIERARIFLRAVSALPVRHEPGCGMYGLMMADMEGGGGRNGIGETMNRLLDDPVKGRWEELDTQARCGVADRAVAKMLQMAKDLEADGSIENIKTALARTGSVSRSPKRLVLDTFGNDGMTHYAQARSLDQKLEVYRASLLMTLCWSVAYAAM